MSKCLIENIQWFHASNGEVLALKISSDFFDYKGKTLALQQWSHVRHIQWFRTSNGGTLAHHWWSLVRFLAYKCWNAASPNILKYPVVSHVYKMCLLMYICMQSIMHVLYVFCVCAIFVLNFSFFNSHYFVKSNLHPFKHRVNTKKSCNRKSPIRSHLMDRFPLLLHRLQMAC